MAIRLSGMVSGLDTDSLVQELVSAYSTKRDTYVKAQTKTEWKMDAWKDMNKQIYGFYTKQLSNMRFSSAYSVKNTSISDDKVATVSASAGAVNGSYSLEVKELASSGYLTGAKLSTKSKEAVTESTKLSDMGIEAGSKIKVNDTEIEIKDDMTVKGLVDEMKKAGVSVNFDEKNQRLFVNSSKSGAEGEFSLTAANEDGITALSSLGLFAAKDIDGNETGEMAYYRKLVEENKDKADADVSDEVKAARAIVEAMDNVAADDDSDAVKAAHAAIDGASTAARIQGKDATIILNGAEFTSSTGTFSINGLNIAANKVTDAPVTISTTTDAQGIYDKIKSFFKDYNELITSMDKAYNADKCDYEPLTDEEQEEMSDKQIEKWETKIKDAILRRDSTLGNVSSAMKTMMQTSVEIDGKSYSLSDFGIGTLGYFSSGDNEKGVYHINGDADDENTSGKTDKLMAAINENPELVSEFFQKLTTNVYNDLTKRMASSTVSSAFTIYNDKQMSSEYSRQKDYVDKWNEKLEDYEDMYYDKFSSMETALSKLQSQTSSLSSLLGG